MNEPKPFEFEPSGEAKRFAPAVERNRDAIIKVLGDVLPETGSIVEIASGTGEHIVGFARAFPRLEWQPSDPDSVALASIAAWRDAENLPNLAAPVHIDASAPQWCIGSADALICINMVHISPWAATVGLFAGAAKVLKPGGKLMLYGPYIRAGVETAPSNLAFDASLRERNSEWGVRPVESMIDQAALKGLSFEDLIVMPANNFSLIFRNDNAGQK